MKFSTTFRKGSFPFPIISHILFHYILYIIHFLHELLYLSYFYIPNHYILSRKFGVTFQFVNSICR